MQAYSIALKLSIRTDIEESARGIVRARAESVAVREELDSVDIRVMGRKRLAAFLLPNIPELSKRIASSRDELVVVERIYAQTHHIAEMVRELRNLLARLNIPQHASHISGGGEDTPIVDESAAAEVARVSTKLSCHSRWPFSGR